MNYKYFLFAFVFLMFVSVPVIHASDDWVNMTNNTAAANFGTVRTGVDTGYSSNVNLNVTTNCTSSLTINFTKLTANLVSGSNIIDKSNVYLFLTINGTQDADYANSADIIVSTKDSLIIPNYKVIVPATTKSGTYTVVQTVNSVCNGTIRKQVNLTLSGTVINSLDSAGLSPFFVVLALLIAAAFVIFVMYESLEAQTLDSKRFIELLVLGIMVAIMLIILATYA